MKRTKKSMALLAAAAVISLSTAHAAGAKDLPVSSELVLQIGQDAVLAGGKRYTLPAPPVLRNGTTLVPLRFIAETFGAKVEWDAVSQSVNLAYNGRQLRLAIGHTEAEVDGKKVNLDTEPLIENQVTMVPLRFIGESFGRQVEYDPATQSITIRTKAANENEAGASGGADSMPSASENTSSTDVKADEPLAKLQPKVFTLTHKLALSEFQDPIKGFTSGTAAKDKLRYKTVNGFVVDRGGSVYLLEKDSKFGPINTFTYTVEQYDPLSGAGSKPVQSRKLESDLNFIYTDAGQNQGLFQYTQFVPQKLTMNEKNGKVYVYGTSKDPSLPYGAILYEVFPQIQVAALIPTKKTSNLSGNAIVFPDDGSVIITNMASGEIFGGPLGQPAALWGKFKEGAGSERKLHALYQDGLLVYDSLDGTWTKVTPNTAAPVNSFAPTKAFGSAPANGKLYLSINNKLMELDAAGRMRQFLDISSLSYKDGVYNSATKAYEAPKSGSSEQPSVPLNRITWFGFDGAGNVVLFDENAHRLRRIEWTP
ncbi:copper amine oxidase N-terminal domain-containing protein [Paenibacillus filicis]|uniref:Copper amine oxidase N-terminal domain-containing protein n=1 Tax=Paenibacillus gyeongsangnamensis TaxID=3388067 RepID=A0ABT4QGK9_9BACL|nr:copper amine oxidase N-terminal domain-containing protein [Paenibacillus filicis]MCZ8515932.1 copper amine oxidase N-terminal domain-containing protein [Paenibacillus filicis]